MYMHNSNVRDECIAMEAASTSLGMAVAPSWRAGIPADSREGSMDAEEFAPALEFQPAWLQHGMPIFEDQQVTSPVYPFPIQPFFSTGTGWQLESGLRVSEAEEADPLSDPVLNYISDMMEEDTEDRTCVLNNYNTYQAMAQDLTNLLTEPSPFEEVSTSHSHNVGSFMQETTQEHVNLVNNFEKVALSSERYPKSDREGYSISSSGMKSSSESRSISSSSMLPKRPGGSSAESSRLNNILEDSFDSDEELIRFIQEKVAAHESGELESDDKSFDLGSEESPKRLASLFPCPENGILTHGAKQADSCPAYIKKPSWDGCPRALGSSEGSRMFQRNEETSEGLEKRRAMEKQNKIKLKSMLIECAKAIAADDITTAYKLANEIRERASAYGDSSQRLAHHFVEGLAARITGTGALLYSALLRSTPPSAAEMLKAFYLFVSNHPNIRISHYFSNQIILDACEGAGKLHIVDYGIRYGFPWPCLIKALGSRPGGPPHLRITGIEFPEPGLKPAERVEDTGRRLEEYARSSGVPFEYNGLATNWENVYPSSLFLRQDEVLVVNCLFRLRHLYDESVKVESPRKIVLSRIRSMNPKVFVQGVLNGCYNSPFFLTRFSEALSFYGSIFDAIDASIPSEHPERLLVEQQILSREILNIVACEGDERVERAESYKHWETRTLRAGFEQMPLNPEIYGKARAMLSSFHKDHGIGQDGNWMLLGWKNRVLNALTTWKPRD
ncbi:hypothetical protein O6H91_17G023400 [Diphasiastrum complanatum]|nr:hypothetical protein O6H91_17G023400 [Diphasiastrum complanatum]